MIEIEVKDLKKNFGSVEALKGVSLHFGGGLMHGVIGPEGAGKTTLFRNILGLLHPDEGSFIFKKNGAEISFEDLRSEMTYMPQQQSLYPDLSIEEHLRFFKELYGLAPSDFEQKKKRLLEITRLTEFVDRPAGKLSGGMYKKLGLMCALLASPSAIFLDEPTNGVDPISRREFWDLLYQLVAEKILVVISTAYMDEAERCSEVHLLQEGKLIGSGEPLGLLRREKVKNFDEYFLKQEKVSDG